MKSTFSRRQFIQTTAAAAAGVGLSRCAFAQTPEPQIAKVAVAKLVPKADAVIHIWLPGGIAQTDTWDPKKFTPFTKGMKGSELLGTCEAIRTSADGIFLGKGLEEMASVMKHGTILRSLTNET